MSSTQVVQHSAVPYALGWGRAIAAAGNDSKASGQACGDGPFCCALTPPPAGNGSEACGDGPLCCVQAPPLTCNVTSSLFANSGVCTFRIL